MRCGGWGSAIKKALRHPKAAAARLLFQAKIKLYEAQGRPIVYIDEAAFHKRQDIKDAISKAGHTLEYLLPY
jgi:hypothetical protein